MCVAVCCSVLQCVAVCCSVLQCIIYVGGSKEEREEQVSCSVLQNVAVCCSVLRCGVAVHHLRWRLQGRARETG